MVNREVLGSVRQTGVVVDGIVADHWRCRLHHRRVVPITVSALRSLVRLLGAAAAVEAVALEMSDRLDDYWQVAPRHGGVVVAHPTQRLVRWGNGHLSCATTFHSIVSQTIVMTFRVLTFSTGFRVGKFVPPGGKTAPAKIFFASKNLLTGYCFNCSVIQWLSLNSDVCLDTCSFLSLLYCSYCLIN